MIYFVRDPAVGLVKIGYSANAWTRLNKIQSDSPGLLVIAAVVAGERVDEASLHERFREERVRGEWFRWAGPVADHVATLESLERPRARDSAKTRINRAIVRLGFSASYGSRLQAGLYQWPLALAIAVWRDCGEQPGPIAAATPEELAVLAKYAPLGREAFPGRRAA